MCQKRLLCLGVKTVRANIENDNLASVKLFVKCGYELKEGKNGLEMVELRKELIK